MRLRRQTCNNILHLFFCLCKMSEIPGQKVMFKAILSSLALKEMALLDWR